MVKPNDPCSQYQQVPVETYTSGSARKIHVRPIEGQPYPVTMKVECCKGMRQSFPLGTKFRIYAKETNRLGGKPFLYSHHSWPYEVVR
ncbi:hypothetical protein E1162_09295 [Rhodobacteraceae bacterium RKSG542]|uniref:hypothetical protein n=1 Tax=Pseudovibrio flavus TaxID=2529854 RepID=UPI0012BBEFF2|nr:hypothetical protein [Pseudovibrio flavus]MTI17433.1 hypothetical protein [Pseudovibrio flavus]